MLKDYEYEPSGSANVFCAVEPKAGVYFNKVSKCLVMDNLSTHSAQILHPAGRTWNWLSGRVGGSWQASEAPLTRDLPPIL
jgi:hypothetical protein